MLNGCLGTDIGILGDVAEMGYLLFAERIVVGRVIGRIGWTRDVVTGIHASPPFLRSVSLCVGRRGREICVWRLSSPWVCILPRHSQNREVRRRWRCGLYT